MVHSAKSIARKIRAGNDGDVNGIAVIPSPDLALLEHSGEASVSLRLGRWFLVLRQAKIHVLELLPGSGETEGKYGKQSFVPFGATFTLHPGRFVLASTLEWIRLPSNCSAVVVGKSTLGRRGIIIETAAGVHPGFSGCLTLEIANVGELPVSLVAGMLICQLFFHPVEGDLGDGKTGLAGQRKPRLGTIREDATLASLLRSRR